MKKTISFLLMFLTFSANVAFCDDTQSDNAFEIPIMAVPPGSPPGNQKSSGLSDGAVTAIVLGSVAGGLAALGGVAYYFAKNDLALKAGQLIGQGNPIETICIKDGQLLAKLKLSCAKYNHLIKAMEKNSVPSSKCSRYLVVQDMSIQNKTYNTVLFNLPKSVNGKPLNVKVTQVSNPFSMNGKKPSLDTRILLNPNEKATKESPLFVSQIEPSNGILEKKGQITDFTRNVAGISTSYNISDKNSVSPQVYAILVEFY